MKYIIPILTLLCFLLLLGYTHDLGKEVLELKEGYRLQGKEIRANRGYIGIVDDKTDRIKAEVADMVRPFTRLIPIDRAWLAIREEEDGN